MLMTRFNPFREMNEFRQALSRLDAMQGYPENINQTALSAFSPAVNTREGEFAYHVEVDLPGVSKKDIEIQIHDNYVTLSGHRKMKNELKEENYYKIESEYGKFEKSFSLPEGVDSENIHAESADGVLEVIIPKLKVTDKSPKKIEIK